MREKLESAAGMATLVPGGIAGLVGSYYLQDVSHGWAIVTAVPAAVFLAIGAMLPFLSVFGLFRSLIGPPPGVCLNARSP